MNPVFNFHLSERTARQILSDPLTPKDPTFEDVRAALARLDAGDNVNASDPVADAAQAARAILDCLAADVSISTTQLSSALAGAGTPIEWALFPKLRAHPSMTGYWYEDKPKPGTFGKPSYRWWRPLTHAEKVAQVKADMKK